MAQKNPTGAVASNGDRWADCNSCVRHREQARDALRGEPYLMSVTGGSRPLGISRSSMYRLIHAGRVQTADARLTADEGVIRIVRDSLEVLLADWLCHAECEK